MATVTVETANVDTKKAETLAESQYEKWNHWPINWSAIWTGTLAAIVALLLFGLIGVAIGTRLVDPGERIVNLRKLYLGAVILSILGSFLSFLIGGWIAGKVAGILRNEPGMLHGAIVWLTSVPLLVILTALGAGGSLGAWYAGLASPLGQATEAASSRPQPPGTGATAREQEDYQKELSQWQEDTWKVTRNTALFAVTALLLGLMGSVVGGLIASGEPLHLGHHRPNAVVRTPMRVQV